MPADREEESSTVWLDGGKVAEIVNIRATASDHTNEAHQTYAPII